MSEPATVTLYTTSWCPFCIRAKRLLERKEVTYREIDVGANPSKRLEMMQRGGGYTVPQIWIGETHIGGCDELYALDRAGRLDSLLREDEPPA